MPPLGPILLAALGFLIARRHPRIGRSVALLALAGLLVLSFPPVADALMRSLERFPPVSREGLANAQAIVILTGGIYHAAPEYGGDTVDRASLQRIRYGVQLQKRTNLPILVTGGSLAGGNKEAQVAKGVIEAELQGKVRWVEDDSRDTAENAQYSARILKAAEISRIVLVSDAWHLPRAAELFEREGLIVAAAPTAFATRPASLVIQGTPSIGALYMSTLALREWLGILAQRLWP